MTIREPWATGWKRNLRPFAIGLAAAARRLGAAQPGCHAELIEAIDALLNDVTAPPRAPEPAERGAIAELAAFVHAAASTLHESVISPTDAAAMAAARDCDSAALDVLDALEGDYGVLSSP